MKLEGSSVGFAPPEGGKKHPIDDTSPGKGGMLTTTGAWGGGGVNTMPPPGMGAGGAEDRSVALPRVPFLDQVITP
jgi:hypothetical protein